MPDIIYVVTAGCSGDTWAEVVFLEKEEAEMYCKNDRYAFYNEFRKQEDGRWIRYD